MLPRGQDDLLRGGELSPNGQPRDRAVVLGIKAAAGYGIEKLCRLPFDLQNLRAGTFAGGEPPTDFTVAFPLFRIAPGVLTLHVGGAAAVFEIVDAVFAHEFILNLPQVKPDMRELMIKERAGEQVLV